MEGPAISVILHKDMPHIDCNIMKHIRLIVLLLIGWNPAQGALLIDFTGHSGFYSDGTDRVIGWDFTTGSSPVFLTELGFFDRDKNGLVVAHDVGLYNTATTELIASASIPSGTAATLNSFFRTVSITPVALSPNTTYTIAGSMPNNTDSWIWDDGILGISIDTLVANPLITTGTLPGRYLPFTATLSFPSSQIGDSRNFFIGPNATIVLPEPSTGMLLILGTASILWRCPRRD